MLKTITAGCEVSPTLLREEKDAGHVLIGVVMVNVVSKLSSWIVWVFVCQVLISRIYLECDQSFSASYDDS